MDPQNAQFYALFVAPELILWKAEELKSRGTSLTADEVINLYREIQYSASTAVSSAESVKAARYGSPQLEAPDHQEGPDPHPFERLDEDNPDGLGVEVEKPKPKRKAKQSTTPWGKGNKAEYVRNQTPLDQTKTPEGRALRQFRHERAMTQAEFATLTGIHPVTVSQYERGVARPSEKTRQRLQARFPELTFDEE